MKSLRRYFSLVKYYSVSHDWLLVFFRRLLAVYGGIWLCVETLSFFHKDAELWLSTKGVWFLVLGFLVVSFLSRPKTVVACQLNNRDVTIEIRVADAFDVSGDLVITTNTTFDTDFGGKIPNAQSTQGKLTRMYYDSEVSHLDLDIQKSLVKEGYCYEELPDTTRGKKRKYPIGTVIQFKRKNRLFYLLANSHINNEGVANTTIENIRESLANLWYYISEKGFKSDIVIPLVGTGKARLGEKREDIFREIIRSFVASCSSGAYCDKLVVVIYPPDVAKHKINLNNLKRFLEFSCDYARFED